MIFDGDQIFVGTPHWMSLLYANIVLTKASQRKFPLRNNIIGITGVGGWVTNIMLLCKRQYLADLLFGAVVSYPRSISFSQSKLVRTFTLILLPILADNVVRTKRWRKQIKISVTRYWNKKWPNCSKNVRKSSHSSFYIKRDMYQNNPKSHKIFGPLIQDNLLPRT